MRATLEHAVVDAGLAEDRSRSARVCRFAIVRSASQRQFFVAQGEPIGRPAFHQRQCLQQLDGRAREHRALDVAERGDERAIAIHHRNRAAVKGFDGIAAPGFDQDRIRP